MLLGFHSRLISAIDLHGYKIYQTYCTHAFEFQFSIVGNIALSEGKKICLARESHE